uniref:AAA+ ATPase domain-containing protein n=2 Tax=Octopus bimaculoides TaxID=37653 RepID=A0A0L8FFW9_OCTBM|eukprot:XP_014790207.1 PREDICTED: cancer-related nucleoside-triphosphatase homolog [Octopus bimaculoides]
MAECEAAESEIRHVLITGARGVGKTTILQKACEELEKEGFALHGFYREKVRHFGRGKGYDVVNLNKERAKLSRVDDEGGFLNRHDPNRSGRYLVQVEEFEEFVLPLLHASNTGITVIDEIGKLEAYSRSFHQAVLSRLDDPRSKVFATIPARKGRPIPLVEQVRNRTDVKVFTVTKENRHSILSNVLSVIKKIASEN